MAMEFETPLRTVLSPLGLTLYDVEFERGTLSVVVNKEGGVDLESLTAANRAISEWLDQHDPIASRYTLDVSSPGLERKLRTPAHFASAIGETVTLREIRDGEATRRLEGTVLAANEDSVTLRDAQHGEVTVPLASIERARTVFEWGAPAKPTPSRGKTNTTAGRKG